MIKLLGKRSWAVGILLVIAVAFGAYAATVRIQERGSSVYTRQGHQTLREDAILTTSYVSSRDIRLTVYHDIGLFFELTKGSLTSFQYKVQWSHDGTTWFDEATETVSASSITDTVCSYTHTLAGDTNYYKPLPYRGNYLRVQVKGTGTVTGSSCAMYLEAFN